MDQTINFSYINKLLMDWINCIQYPLLTCRKILKLKSNNEKFYISFRIWITSFVMSFCLEFPILYYHGINKEYSFYISYTLIGTFSLILSSFILHITLLLFNIKSKYNEIFVVYSVIIGTYAPFLLLSSYINIFGVVHFLSVIKSKSPDNLKAFYYLFKESINNIDIHFYLISHILKTLNIILLSITSVLLSYIIMEIYNCSKLKSLVIIAFSQIILILPLLLLSFFKNLIIYFYLK